MRQSKVTPREWNKQSRVSSLVKEGLLQKACGTLVREPPVEISRDVIQEMESKHPRGRDSEMGRNMALRPISSSAAPEISLDDVVKAIRSFPRGSAAGLSALRPQHLKDALVPGMADEMLRQLCEVVDILVKGQANPAVHAWLCGGSLSALRNTFGEGSHSSDVSASRGHA